MVDRLADPVRVVARRRPGAPAIVAPAETVTYADLDRRVDAMVVALRSRGLRRGDRLAIYRSPDVGYLAILLAAFRSGVVVCPLNTRQPAAAVPELLDRIACRTLVAAPDEAWGDLDVLVPDELAESEGENPPGSDPMWRLDEPATLVFTSGSTGTPKAALHTFGNHVWSARGSVTFFDLGPDDRWLLNLPLYHVGGFAILVRCVLAGAAVALPAADESLGETVRARGVTHLSLVATQLLRALRDEQPALAGAKAILLGGSAIPPGLVADAQDRGLPIHLSYGMTEMSSTVTATPPDASAAALGTSGVVLPYRAVRVADDGEVLVGGATLFAGYAENGRVEREDCGGWFPTGDLGVWDEVEGERMLRIIGRKDHLFISGGENVQPEEVEAALGRLGGVRRAVVVPVADGEFGQRPVAFVEADRWTPAAWRDALGDALPRFKVPVAFYPWPNDAQGGVKVSRAVLRAHAVALRAPAP